MRGDKPSLALICMAIAVTALMLVAVIAVVVGGVVEWLIRLQH